MRKSVPYCGRNEPSALPNDEFKAGFTLQDLQLLTDCRWREPEARGGPVDGTCCNDRAEGTESMKIKHTLIVKKRFMIMQKYSIVL